MKDTKSLKQTGFIHDNRKFNFKNRKTPTNFNDHPVKPFDGHYPTLQAQAKKREYSQGAF